MTFKHKVHLVSSSRNILSQTFYRMFITLSIRKKRKFLTRKMFIKLLSSKISVLLSKQLVSVLMIWELLDFRLIQFSRQKETSKQFRLYSKQFLFRQFRLYSLIQRLVFILFIPRNSFYFLFLLSLFSQKYDGLDLQFY